MFADVFNKDGFELDWLWYRIEYQARGAPQVHGCFKFKNDPCLSKHAQNVFRGRLASLALNTTNLLHSSPDFDSYVTDLDIWELEDFSPHDLIREC